MENPEVKVISVKYPRRRRKILEALSEYWQTSIEMSCKSGRSPGEVSSFMKVLEGLGYVESKIVSRNTKAWRLKEGLIGKLILKKGDRLLLNPQLKRGDDVDEEPSMSQM